MEGQNAGINDIQAERDRVEKLRACAEECDTVAKPEDYVFVDPYRLVRPYHFDFLCGVKQRHAGLDIVDLFCTEFPARDRAYYTHAFNIGLLRAENNPFITSTTPLSAGTRCRHLVHRHEPPVPCTPIQILGTTDDIVVVSKPAGIPVHVAGQYRKNTVLDILKSERQDLGALLPVHRLDKPVSGVLMFARSSQAADRLRIGIADKGEVEKFYIARVQGVVEWDQLQDDNKGGISRRKNERGDDIIIVNVALGFDAQENHAVFGDPFDATEQQVETGSAYDANNSTTGQPPAKKIKKNKIERVAAFEARSSTSRVRNGGIDPRPATTEFRLLSTSGSAIDNTTTSLVECRPLTGRTHQIRAHLAWLGCPIGNDGQYGGSWPGPLGGRAMAEKMGVAWHRPASSSNGLDSIERREDRGGIQNGISPESQQPPPVLLPEELRDPHCPHCPFYAPSNYPIDTRPLWLHAKRYACSEWCFEAPLPEWAEETYTPI